MSIYFLSPDPKRLLESFDEAIRNQDIKTWRAIQIEQKNVYTHTSSQWKDRAILKPDDTENGRLAFYVKRFHGTLLIPDVFEYYQAHLEETFTRHFSSQFGDTQSTSTPSGEDDGFGFTA
jgi:hypothetical protein